ncbi:MAG: DNA polymerase III subunit alpha [Gemmatimonadota bacterium]
MATAEFVHLHGHSEYSLLDGGCHVEAMAEQAGQYGMPGLAITDHGNLFGAIDHYKACSEAGVKPILGCEVYVSIGSRHLRQAARGLTHGSNHLVLLARDAAGWRNLTKLVSRGYLEGYYYNPRVDKELLRQHRDGLTCLSGCIGGEIAHLLQTEGLTAAERVAREYHDIFGQHYYLEMQRHGIDGEAAVNEGLLKLSRKLGLPLVATNDFHFLRADDHAAHDALVCIQTGKTVAETNRLCYPTGLYMKTAAEMQKLFRDLPEAVENTVRIAEQCDLSFEFGKMRLPAFPIPAGFDSDLAYLTHLASEGMRRRYGHIGEALQKRLEYELGIIAQMGYCGYFLIVWDYINYARQQGITVGPGRGSAAGSLVAYSLGITGIDPIKYDLLFERFLNPERVSMPDVDVDFPDTGRDQVIRYVVEKYGEESVCQVITFGTMGAKAVIRDVGRVLGMPFGEVDAIAKLVPNDLKMTLDKAIERVPELQEMAGGSDAQKSLLIAHARRLEGLARHASVHAAAVIIAPGDLTEYVPLYRAPKDGRITTQFDGPTCEDMGLLKMDFLGLKELSLADEAVRLIRLREPDFDLARVPLDDRRTYELFSRGDTVGVFQFESGGMREYLAQLKPDRFEDLIAMNALYRPGPMEKIPDYIERKHGRQEVTYLHPDLAPILAETHGVIVYQEQVLQIAQRLAGFTLGQADILRRAMGKKKAEEMARQRQAFTEGCCSRGVERRIADQLFGDIEVFSGYGFNKSHSAPYADLAYRNAYLKANYSAEYMAASLTISMADTDKVTGLLDECRHLEIAVLPPDVSESAVNFTPTPDGIRFGLAAVKNVGAGAAQAIVDERLANGPYADLFDLAERLDLHAVNRRVFESLVAAGAMDRLPGHRAQQLAGLDLALKHAQSVQELRERGQFSLFQVDSGPAVQFEKPALPAVEEWSETERLARERELLGFYLSSHPLDRFAQDLRFFATPLAAVGGDDEAGPVRVGGIVTRVSTSTDRRGQTIAFVTLEDLSGTADIVFFSDAYSACRELVQPDQVVLVEARVSRRNGGLSLQGESALPLAQARERLTKAVNVAIPFDGAAADLLERLRRLCEEYSGPCELLIHLRNEGQKGAVVRSRSLRVSPCDDLLLAFERVGGPSSSWLTPVPQAARGGRL